MSFRYHTHTHTERAPHIPEAHGEEGGGLKGQERQFIQGEEGGGEKRMEGGRRDDEKEGRESWG